LKKGSDVSELETNTALEEPQDVEPIRPREGLPSGYRMRADRHYVDELTSEDRRRQPPVMAPPQPVDSERSGGSARSADLFRSLLEEFTAIESARRLLADTGTAIARRAALDLIEVHTARAAWLIKATRFVESEAPQPDRRQALGPLIDNLVEQFAPEGRLRGVTLRARVDDRAYSTRFDAHALSIGLTGAVVALLPFVDVDEEPALHIDASRSTGSLTVHVVHRSTKLDPTSGERLFDGTWTVRPGGWPAALGMLALKRAVEHHGGNVGFEVRHGEARLRLTFPQETA
jgi:hypothetical protein